MDLEHLEIGLHVVNVTNKNLVLVGVWDILLGIKFFAIFSMCIRNGRKEDD